MSPISTYLRYRARAGRYVPFPPPLPSPKHTGRLSLKQQAHWWLWRWGLPLWSATLGRLYVSRRPIFLIGCHNSGTTILARLIGQHPSIVNWSEAPEVWTPDDAFMNWSVLPEPPLPLPFLFDLDAYERTVEKHAAYLPLIRNSFTLFAVMRLRRRFLNKNPHMSISVPYIEAAFPDACYVYIRRNGYAVVQSLLSNWRPVLEAISDPAATTPEWHNLREVLDPAYFSDPLALVRLCARYWREMESRAREALTALPDQRRVYYTSYEDLCERTEPILREIFAQFDLNPHRYNWDQLRQPSRYPWTDMLPMENRNFKYRERLTRHEIDAITGEARALLTEYGYLDEDGA